MNEGNQNEPDKNRSAGKAKQNKTAIILIIALVIVLGALVGVYIYKTNTIQQKETELLQAYENLDSIGDQLDSKIVEIEKLGGDVEELTTAKQELEEEREELLKNKRYTEQQLGRLRERLDGYKELLIMKDEEIEQLKKVNEELVTENTELKTEKNQLNERLQQAQQTQEKLNQKVERASKLEAENINVFAVSRGGREREGEFRSRQIDHLKVEFNISKNDVAPIEGKEILIRITDENGNVIFDVAKGSGTFMLDDEETFYTAKQEILFDNSQQELTFVYNKGSEYERGTYKMEVFTDGYSMGSKTFRVK